MKNHTRLLLAALVVLLAACGSKQDRIDSGLKKGGDYVRGSDWDKAQVEMRNVLQIDPKNAAAYHIAAMASEGQGELQRAFSQYNKALELNPALLDARAAQARLLLLGGDIDRAAAGVDAVLAADPRHARARTLRAALLARQGKPAEAETLAREVIAQPDAPPDASLLLAGLQANRKQWNEASAVVEAALARDPRHPGLLQVAVEIASAEPGNPALAAKAASFYQRATVQAPKDHALWLAWARWHVARNELDPAEAVLRQSVKAQPDDNKRTLALLEFLATRRGAAVAEKETLAAIEDKPRDMALRFALANQYRAANRGNDAQQVLHQIVDRADDTPSTVAAQSQLAAFALQSGRLDDARSLLAAVLKANPRDGSALLLRGRLHLMTDAPRDAVTDLRAALRDQPGTLEIVRLLAQAHRSAGEPQLAREALAEAVKSKPQDPALRAALAADMADSKDFISAYAELDAAIRNHPQAIPLYELKAQIAVAQKDTATAIKTLEQLKAQRPKDALPYIGLARLHAGERRFDAALKELDAGTVAAGNDPSPYVGVVSLLTRLQRPAEAQARIDARRKADPANEVLHQQLSAEVALARKDPSAAAAAWRAVIAAAPQAATGYLGLARLQRQRGEAGAALNTVLEGEKAAPADRALPMVRADWLTQDRRYDEAIALYDGLRARFPDDDTIVNNLAYLLAEMKGDRGSTERALALASRFAQSRNPGQLDSLGWIHYRLGQYDKAVPLLERAVALGATPLLQLHLGKALVKSGNAARGKPLIQRAIDSQPDLPRIDEARELLAQT